MATHAQPGDRVGRYSIEALLGEGGMGQVYRAYDELLRRRVAIKILHPESSARPGSAESSAGAIGRIRREARMAAALDHPNVVAIFDMGEHDGAAYIVMEHVVGSSLRGFVAVYGVPVARRLRWLADVARALAAAHRAGLVHRDIKPENVMVRDDGVIKVLDFGIARHAARGNVAPLPNGLEKSVSPGMHETLSGTMDDGRLVGTPGYIAPEQIIHGSIDARSDQFAWGVLAYEMVTGRLPWGANETEAMNTAALISAALLEEPPTLVASAEGLSAVAVAAIHRTLAKNPADRFDSMDAVVACLEGRNSGHPDALLPTGTATARALAETMRSDSDSNPLPALTPPGTINKAPVRRPRRAGWIIAACAAALVAAGAIPIAARRRNARTGHPNAPSHAMNTAPSFHPHGVRRLTFDEGCEEYPSFTPDGRSVLYDGAGGSDYHVYLLDTESGTRRAVTSGAGWQWAAALSPDGRQIAYLDSSASRVSVLVGPLDSSAPPRVLASGSARPSWTPDGAAVWAGDRAAVQRVNVATANVDRTLSAPAGWYITHAIELRDGRVIVRTVHQGGLTGGGIGAFAPGQRVMRWLYREPVDEVLALTPDGAGLITARVASTRGTELQWVPFGGGAAIAFTGSEALPTKGLALAPDARRVVWSTCTTQTGLAVLTRADGGATLTSSSLAGARAWSDSDPVGVPGTDLVVLLSDRSGRFQPWVIDRSGRASPRMINTAGLDPNGLAVSPDQRSIAFSVPASGLYLVPFDGSSPPRRLTEGSSDRYACFDRAGRHVYFETAAPEGGRRIMRIAVGGGAIEPVLEHGSARPTTSSAADVLGFVSMRGPDTGVPMLLDLVSARRSPMSASLPVGNYMAMRISPAGDRALLTDRANALTEIELPSGSVIGRFASGGDEITGMTYSRGDVLIARAEWLGDLWIGDEPLGRTIAIVPAAAH